MSSQPVLDEDEFKNRDEMGLMPLKEKGDPEAAAKKFYMKLTARNNVIGQILSWVLYFFFAKLLDQQEIYDKKFAFIREYQLGYLFLGAWIVAQTRHFCVVNANVARAGARVDRPDQHVYKIMAADGSLKDAPYVMMVNTGALGRFNRAQRAVFHMDEGIPMLITGVLLVGSVFGPAVLVILSMGTYGRIVFAMKYIGATNERSNGFFALFTASTWMTNMILLCAIKGIFKLPF